MSSKKTLILMRHAQPVSDAAVSDFYIPLAKEGITAQKKLCQKLEQKGFFPKEVLASPFRRTRDTGDIIAQHFNLKCQVFEALGDPFNEELLRDWIENAESDTFALVGHGPSLTDLANQYLGEDIFNHILPKSSAVIIGFEKSIANGLGKLIEVFK